MCSFLCVLYLYNFQWVWAEICWVPLYILELGTRQRQYPPQQGYRLLLPVLIHQAPPHPCSHHSWTLIPTEAPRRTVGKERTIQLPGGEQKKQRWERRPLRVYICITASGCTSHRGGVEDFKVFLQTPADCHRAKPQHWTTLLFFILRCWTSQLKKWVLGWKGKQRQDKRQVREYWFLFFD